MLDLKKQRKRFVKIISKNKLSKKPFFSIFQPTSEPSFKIICYLCAINTSHRNGKP